MYFKNLAEKMADAPDYIIEDLLKYRGEVAAAAKLDFRKIMGEKTLIFPIKDSSPELKTQIEFVQNYIMSQQWSILKEKVPYERSLVMVNNLNDSTNVPNRYINRIGENILLVINGSATIKSEEFPADITMRTGEVWRYNSRVPIHYTYTPDYFGLVISYVDFDLMHYLMPFDVFGLMPRRRDEFPDYDPNDDLSNLDTVNTNDY